VGVSVGGWVGGWVTHWAIIRVYLLCTLANLVCMYGTH
jgi:hypothetical protein